MSASPVYSHSSVMVEEVLQHLCPRPGGVYCDATLGGGGHSEHLLERSSPDGRVFGVDRDPTSLSAAAQRLSRFGARFIPVHGRFGDLPELLAACGVNRVNGLLADVGVSSPQIDRPERGFSFQQRGPIDMRMDPGSGESALDLIRRLSAGQLAEILDVYGEERFARRVAASIKRAEEQGRLADTLALASAIAAAVPKWEPGKDPATRSFQALRIAVNDELRQLDQLLHCAPDLLHPGGRLAIISFHSLEDRVVKHRLRSLSQEETGGGPGMILPDAGPAPVLTLLTRKAIFATEAEVAQNPRARSARLRAAMRRAPSVTNPTTPPRPGRIGRS